jgi:hypothetical protein
LGGFAFSWKDRYEGTATWFGITDYKGRLKPTYYFLESAWKGLDKVNPNFPDISIVGHWHLLQPGETIWLSAAIINNYNGKLNYTWEVYDNKNWRKSTPILTTLKEGQFAEIEVPEHPSRVYVFATDSLGNVISASRALVIKK